MAVSPGMHKQLHIAIDQTINSCEKFEFIKFIVQTLNGCMGFDVGVIGIDGEDMGFDVGVIGIDGEDMGFDRIPCILIVRP